MEDDLETKILSVENTVESVPAHEFRQYVENHHAQQVRNKKTTLVVLKPHQHNLFQRDLSILVTRKTLE